MIEEMCIKGTEMPESEVEECVKERINGDLQKTSEKEKKREREKQKNLSATIVLG